MTETAPRPLSAGDQFHAVHSGLSIAVRAGWVPEGVVLQKAQTVTLTDEMLDANRDREGHCWLDLVDDEHAQILRWGQVMIRRGSAPDDLTPWEPGSADHDLAREKARRAAWALTDEDARSAALAEVDAAYGRPKTSRTTAVYRGEQERGA